MALLESFGAGTIVMWMRVVTTMGAGTAMRVAASMRVITTLRIVMLRSTTYRGCHVPVRMVWYVAVM